MKIRVVKNEEIETLSNISKLTFSETFAFANSEDDLQTYLDTNLSVNELKKELDNEYSYFYFIEEDKEILGFLKLNTNTAQSEKMEESWLELERIYLTKSAQGRGLGKKLLEFTIEQAIKLNKEAVWLGVWEENYSAIRFYEKRGFKPFGEHIFTLGQDQQKDILYCLNLSKHQDK